MSSERPPQRFIQGKPAFSVSEAAALLGMSSHTLRYYEREGLLPVPRTSSDRRFYRETELSLLRFLLSLRATGMGIERVREYMALTRQGPGTRLQRRDLLAQHEAEVTARLAELQEHLGQLHHKVTLYDAVMASEHRVPDLTLYPEALLCLSAEESALAPG